MSHLKLIDRGRNFLLEAAIQDDSVVFVMTNGDMRHRWMMRVGLEEARAKLTALLTNMPGTNLPGAR